MRLHSLHYSVIEVDRLVMFFWRGWQYTLDILHHLCVSLFSCMCDCSTLLVVGLAEEPIVVGPCFEVSGLESSLSYIIVKHGYLSQKCDLFRNHHRVGVVCHPAHVNYLHFSNCLINRARGSAGL